jgi:hypothetical protein
MSIQVTRQMNATAGDHIVQMIPAMALAARLPKLPLNRAEAVRVPGQSG